MLKLGDRAPDFALQSGEGETVRLGDYVGKRVVLYFYARDNTPGCTRQALAFKEAVEEMEQLGAVVIGVSRDSEASHQRFAAKYELPFPLLSDPERKAIEAYGVWQEKKMYGKVSMGVVRSTFVIGPDGWIEKIYAKVKPDENASQVLAFLREVQQG